MSKKRRLVYKEAYTFNKNYLDAKRIVDGVVGRMSALDAKVVDREGLYFILMELLDHALRTNLKQIYIDRMDTGDQPGSDLNSAVMEKFEREFKTMSRTEQSELMAETAYRIRFAWYAYQDCIRVYVTNNTRLQQSDEKWLRTKLNDAMSMTPTEYTMSQVRNGTAGVGFGIGMIVSILRETGLDPNHLRIFNRSDCSIARLEIPRSVEYIPIRNRYALGA